MFALFLILLVLGIVVACVGSIMLLVAAFRESLWWGVGCLFIAPVSLLFVILKWSEAKSGFLTNLAGILIVALSLVPGRQFVGERLNTSFASAVFAQKDAAPKQPSPVMEELRRREAELRARKTNTSPQDAAAIARLRDDILRYNDDLKRATAQQALASSKIAQSIGNDLLVLQDGFLQPFDPVQLAPVRYYAIYFSAEWCPPCRAFSPQLVDWYKHNKATNPNFELIFVSCDRSAADMQHYMKVDAMPWPAVPFENIHTSPLAHYAGRGIPDLVFIDSDGKVLSDSYSWGTYRGPQAVLAEIDQTLAKNRATFANAR